MFTLPCSTRPGSRRAPLRSRRFLLSSTLQAFSALALLCSPLLTTRAHAQTTLDQTFTYTGGLQFFVVPADVSSVFVRLWGAAGAGFVATPSHYAGGGAFVSGSLSVTPGSTLTLLVGGGGSVSTTGNNGGFGGGGNTGGFGVLGGGGGGRSGILLGATELVDAGGGGGVGTSGFFEAGTNGGAGGVVTGYAGAGTSAGVQVGGAGGTQTAGGAGGTGNSGTGGNGGPLVGGIGTPGGGGGGGGYFGGGGGSDYSYSIPDVGIQSYPGGGGGGSSYTSGSLFTLTLGEDGSGGIPGGTSDPFYLADVGVGSKGFSTGNSYFTRGGNGEIVLSYATSAVPEPGSVALLVGIAVTGAGFLARRKTRSR